MSCSQSSDPNKVEVELRDRVFNIPNEFFGEEQVPAWLRNLPGLDHHGSELLLTVKAEYMAKNIPGYIPKNGKYREDVLLYFSVMSERGRIAAPVPNKEQQDLWNARGLYKTRIIEKHDQYYRVYRDFEYPSLWEQLMVFPDSKKPLPDSVFDYWVGVCYEAMAPIAATPFYKCKIQMLESGNLFFDFSVSEQNMHLLDEIKKLLLEHVESWEVH